MENLTYRYEIRIGEKEKQILDDLKQKGVNTSQLLRDYILTLAERESPKQAEQPKEERERKPKSYGEKKKIEDNIKRLKNRLSTVAYHLQSVVLERNKHTLKHPYDDDRREIYNNSIKDLEAEKEAIKNQIKELKKQLKKV